MCIYIYEYVYGVGCGPRSGVLAGMAPLQVVKPEPRTQVLPRKSVGQTWENRSVHTEFVPTFRNFDFSVKRIFTYELIKQAYLAISHVGHSALHSCVVDTF